MGQRPRGGAEVELSDLTAPEQSLLFKRVGPFANWTWVPNDVLATPAAINSADLEHRTSVPKTRYINTTFSALDHLHIGTRSLTYRVLTAPPTYPGGAELARWPGPPWPWPMPSLHCRRRPPVAASPRPRHERRTRFSSYFLTYTLPFAATPLAPRMAGRRSGPSRALTKRTSRRGPDRVDIADFSPAGGSAASAGR